MLQSKGVLFPSTLWKWQAPTRMPSQWEQHPIPAPGCYADVSGKVFFRTEIECRSCCSASVLIWIRVVISHQDGCLLGGVARNCDEEKPGLLELLINMPLALTHYFSLSLSCSISFILFPTPLVGFKQTHTAEALHQHILRFTEWISKHSLGETKQNPFEFQSKQSFYNPPRYLFPKKAWKLHNHQH